MTDQRIFERSLKRLRKYRLPRSHLEALAAFALYPIVPARLRLFVAAELTRHVRSVFSKCCTLLGLSIIALPAERRRAA